MLSWVSSYFYGGTPIVTVYSKTTTFCGQCMATKRALTDMAIDYIEIPLENVSEAQVDAWRAEGHMTAPIVEIDEGGHTVTQVWSGYRPDLIATLV